MLSGSKGRRRRTIVGYRDNRLRENEEFRIDHEPGLRGMMEKFSDGMMSSVRSFPSINKRCNDHNFDRILVGYAR